MADSYLRINEKGYAKNAFQKASKLNFDSDIKRNSLFNLPPTFVNIHTLG